MKTRSVVTIFIVFLSVISVGQDIRYKDIPYMTPLPDSIDGNEIINCNYITSIIKYIQENGRVFYGDVHIPHIKEEKQFTDSIITIIKRTNFLSTNMVELKILAIIDKNATIYCSIIESNLSKDFEDRVKKLLYKQEFILGIIDDSRVSGLCGYTYKIPIKKYDGLNNKN